jgi:hypothetical protein
MKPLIAALSLLALAGCVTVQQAVPVQPNCIGIDSNRPGQAPADQGQTRANPGCQTQAVAPR